MVKVWSKFEYDTTAEWPLPDNNGQVLPVNDADIQLKVVITCEGECQQQILHGLIGKQPNGVKGYRIVYRCLKCGRLRVFGSSRF